MGRLPWAVMARVNRDGPALGCSRLVKAAPLSDSTRAGAPCALIALVMATMAAWAVSDAAAWQATRRRVQSSMTSKTTTGVPSARRVSVASIW
jgi:hypothetical protein